MLKRKFWISLPLAGIPDLNVLLQIYVCTGLSKKMDVLTSLQPALSSTPVVFSVITGVQWNTDGQVPIMHMFSVIWTVSHKTGVQPWSWCSIHPFPTFKTKLVSFHFTLNGRNSNHHWVQGRGWLWKSHPLPCTCTWLTTGVNIAPASQGHPLAVPVSTTSASAV